VIDTDGGQIIMNADGDNIITEQGVIYVNDNSGTIIVNGYSASVFTNQGEVIYITQDMNSFGMKVRDWFWNNLIVFPFLNIFWMMMLIVGDMLAFFGDNEWWAINTMPFYTDTFGTPAQAVFPYYYTPA
jgi:hypothetical protein